MSHENIIRIGEREGWLGAYYQSSLPVEVRCAIRDAEVALEDTLISLYVNELQGITRRHLMGEMTDEDRAALVYEAAQQLDQAAQYIDKSSRPARDFALAGARALVLQGLAGNLGVDIRDAMAAHNMIHDHG